MVVLTGQSPFQYLHVVQRQPTLFLHGALGAAGRTSKYMGGTIKNLASLDAFKQDTSVMPSLNGNAALHLSCLPSSSYVRLDIQTATW